MEGQVRLRLLWLLGNGTQIRADFQDVVAGQKPWNKARLLLVQYEGKSARYNVPHQVAGLEGTHDWEHYEAVFEIMPWAAEFGVVAQLSRCTGRLEIKNIQLYPVRVSNEHLDACRGHRNGPALY